MAPNRLDELPEVNVRFLSFFHATDSMNYRMNISSFFHVDWQIGNDFFNRPITDAYSNLGTQMGAHNKDFGAVLQMDF